MKGNIVISHTLEAKIDKFVKKLSSNLKEEEAVIRDFEDEMKYNLKSSVIELIDDGYSEDEAFKLAVNRFGEGYQIEDELTKVYKVQKSLSKKLLMPMLIFALLSSITFIILCFSNWTENTRNNEVFSALGTYGTGDKDAFFENAKELFEKNKDNFRYIAIFFNWGDEWNNKTEKIVFIYPDNISPNELNLTTSVSQTINNRHDSLGSEYKIKLQIGFKKGKGLYGTQRLAMKVIVVTLFIIYWVLFGIWASAKANEAKQNKLIWNIMFFTLNIIGYLLFRSRTLSLSKNKAQMRS